MSTSPTPTPTASKVKIPVRSISIEQVEGPKDTTLRNGLAHSFQEANAILARICATAPQKGGYFKTDFLVTFADGNTYAGRFDAKHPSSRDYEKPDLALHMRRNLEFMAGLRRPAHMTEEKYAQVLDEDLKRVGESTRFLTTYALEDVADVALAVPVDVAAPLEDLVSIMAGIIRSLEEDAKLLRRTGNPLGATTQDQRAYEIRKALVFIQKAKDIR